jgi:hypothetical protein
VISGDDLRAPLFEAAQIVVPKKGKLFEEKMIEGGHTVKVAKFAIIRPCQSRGRRIRGHAPIYEPRMLAESSGVFSGWPMYIDHMDEELAEEVMELLQEKGRSLNSLGGRVLRSFYDPDLVFEDDAEHGYRKGGVVGEVVPQKSIREMLEEDPGCLNVSINAWPKSVRIGEASWDSSIKGALIEGIRNKPMGSVDFVFKGGAGGRPLTEEERRSAVSLLESAYTASRDDERRKKEPVVKKKLSEMSGDEIAALTATQLTEALAEENPDLAESLSEKETTPAKPSETGGITEAQLQEALSSQRDAIVSEFKLGEVDTLAEEKAEEIVAEREEYRELAGVAEKAVSELERNGLPKSFGNEIRKNYLLTASGPRPGLEVQERETDDGTLSKAAVLKENIKGEAETAVQLIESAGGSARVTGLGPSGEDANGGGKGKDGKRAGLREGSAFTDFLAESGDLTGDAEKDQTHLAEMLES